MCVCVVNGNGNGNGKTNMNGTVLKATYLGGHVEYTVETTLGEIFVVDHQFDTPIAAGASVRIVLRDRGVTLLKPDD